MICLDEDASRADLGTEWKSSGYRPRNAEVMEVRVQGQVVIAISSNSYYVFAFIFQV